MKRYIIIFKETVPICTCCITILITTKRWAKPSHGHMSINLDIHEMRKKDKKLWERERECEERCGKAIVDIGALLTKRATNGHFPWFMSLGLV